MCAIFPPQNLAMLLGMNAGGGGGGMDTSVSSGSQSFLGHATSQTGESEKFSLGDVIDS